MKKNNNSAIVLLEGEHEECFLEDWRNNHGSFLENIAMKVIHAGQISAHIVAYNYKKIIYFIVDDDVAQVNKAIIYNKVFTDQNEIKFQPIKSSPEFGTFCAAFFKDFEINETWNEKKIKKEAQNFLTRKDSKVGLKKWTYTNILQNGGNFENVQRYHTRFKILPYLKLNK